MGRHAVVVAILAVVALSIGTRPRAEDAVIADGNALARTEVQRIRRHFDSVVVELASRDVSTLSGLQRSNRAALTETLHAYRDRGLFPRNYEFAEPTPYFIDRRTDVLCAVAHLMASTGHRSLVDRIAARDNNVWVADLAGDPDVEQWLEKQGITLAEAARIQVPYEMVPVQESRPEFGARVRYFAGSAAAVSTSLAAVALRDRVPRRGVGLLGAAAGLGSILLAANAPRTGGMTPAVRAATIANVAVGLTGLVLGVNELHRLSAIEQARNGAPAADAEGARVSVSPFVSPSDGAGLSLAVRVPLR